MMNRSGGESWSRSYVADACCMRGLQSGGSAEPCRLVQGESRNGRRPGWLIVWNGEAVSETLPRHIGRNACLEVKRVETGLGDEGAASCRCAIRAQGARTTPGLVAATVRPIEGALEPLRPGLRRYRDQATSCSLLA